MTRAALLGLLLCLLPWPGFAATMEPVRMNVVDAQDDSPVPDAFVLFQASAHEGTWTGHGGRHANLFAAEAVTDDSGAFQLPKQEFSAQSFFLNTNYDNPSMVVLKAGYVLVILTNSRRVIPELQDMTSWQYNNQMIELKRATTEREMSDAVSLAAMHVNQTGLCSWKNTPRFLMALDALTAEWLRQREPVPSIARAQLPAYSPLRRILMNDDVYRQKGCGSPRAFFEPYLR